MYVQAYSWELCVIATTWRQPKCLFKRTSEINDGIATQWNTMQLLAKKEEKKGGKAWRRWERRKNEAAVYVLICKSLLYMLLGKTTRTRTAYMYANPYNFTHLHKGILDSYTRNLVLP